MTYSRFFHFLVRHRQKEKKKKRKRLKWLTIDDLLAHKKYARRLIRFNLGIAEGVFSELRRVNCRGWLTGKIEERSREAVNSEEMSSRRRKENLKIGAFFPILNRHAARGNTFDWPFDCEEMKRLRVTKKLKSRDDRRATHQCTSCIFKWAIEWLFKSFFSFFISFFLYKIHLHPFFSIFYFYFRVQCIMYSAKLCWYIRHLESRKQCSLSGEHVSIRDREKPRYTIGAWERAEWDLHNGQRTVSLLDDSDWTARVPCLC